MFLALDSVPVPLIGRIHGAALGGGSGLAAVCDVVVAADDAMFGFTEVDARDSAGDDLAVCRAQDRALGRARAVPERRRASAPRAQRRSASSTRSSRPRTSTSRSTAARSSFSRPRRRPSRERSGCLPVLRPAAGRRAGADVEAIATAARLARRPGRHARVPRKAARAVGTPRDEAVRLMIRRVLIANRGEIARRVIRTCRAMGIETVAVYSDADADAPHVQEADEAERIGPAPAAESYLNIANGHRRRDDARAPTPCIPATDSCRRTPAFAEACEQAGLIFVGPPAAVIRRMGSKTATRATMSPAGVPVVPGATPASQSNAGIAAAVREVGLPVLLKAAGGGGGKGMRVVRTRRTSTSAIAAARSEAERAFGNGALYVERLIERARHIEVQIMGDTHGNIVHLFERDCTLQRRHQKVIEEAPAPTLAAAVRERIDGGWRRCRPRRRLRQRRHRRVPARRRGRRGAVLFPRNEHAPAGGASGDRADHRARPRARADAGRLRRAAALPAVRHPRDGPRDRVPRLRRRRAHGCCRSPAGSCGTGSRPATASASIRVSRPARPSPCTTTRCSPKSLRMARRALQAIERLLARSASTTYWACGTTSRFSRRCCGGLKSSRATYTRDSSRTIWMSCRRGPLRNDRAARRDGGVVAGRASEPAGFENQGADEDSSAIRGRSLGRWTW